MMNNPLTTSSTSVENEIYLKNSIIVITLFDYKGICNGSIPWVNFNSQNNKGPMEAPLKQEHRHHQSHPLLLHISPKKKKKERQPNQKT